MKKNIKVLALDLEGTLISNAMSQIPRPGLYEFLERVKTMFERVVIFTTVKEYRFRPIAQGLVQEGLAPTWFADIENIEWSGTTKDLSFIPGCEIEEALLVDDFEIYVHPGQEKQWIKISLFASPYPDGDMGLYEVLEILEKRNG
jgi:hypothetical protein